MLTVAMAAALSLALGLWQSAAAAVPQTMRAAAIDKGGGPEVIALQTLPVPRPDPEEVLIALHTAGLPVGPDRCERLARAVTVMGATTVTELRACALATMVSDPGQMSTFDRVFVAVFGGPSPFRDLNLPAAAPGYQRAESGDGPQPAAQSQPSPGGLPSGLRVTDAVPAAADDDEPRILNCTW